MDRRKSGRREGSLREQAKTRQKKKLVERNEPRGEQRARMAFELASSTWNKLPVNNFWTYIPTDCGHTNNTAMRFITIAGFHAQVANQSIH